MPLDLLLKGILVGAALIAGVSSTILFKMKKDNPVEQMSEKIIKDQTGMDIDLTPDTPEDEEPQE